VLARFRAAASTGRMSALVGFHSRHKFLLMAYNQTAMREMGRIVANAEREPVEAVVRRYRRELARALRQAPRRTSAINVLQHAFGHVSDRLTRRERDHFLGALDQYRGARIPLSGPATLMRSWIVRFDVDYLADQAYFEPYPQELADVSDSGKGRAL
jgi:uncharacterized protein YbgA (DUF1722 family)